MDKFLEDYNNWKCTVRKLEFSHDNLFDCHLEWRDNGGFLRMLAPVRVVGKFPITELESISHNAIEERIDECMGL
jgi:hypothetical protein